MTIEDLKKEIINWKFTRYKLINLIIGIVALVLCEFIAKPYYRSYIYSHAIYDFHIADTLGNSLGTIAAIFIPVSILTSDVRLGYPLIKILTVSVVIYELGQPLLGKPIDVWDIVATLLTGVVCYFTYRWLFKKEK